MMTSLKEMLDCLKAGNFEGLVGVVESAWFETKRSPSVFNGDRPKLELAKDVSALANSGGGILVIGFATERLPDMPGDRVAKVNPFPLSFGTRHEN
jgi:hypothetical protein